jgi:hypothetical protein
MFGNDHLLWLLESYLEQSESDVFNELEEDTIEPAVILHKDADNEQLYKKRISESQSNTVEGVIAQDMPDLTESYLAKDDFYKTLL